MAISFSRPDPSSPSAVAAASFPVVRRGFDQGDVRDFLSMVGAELGRLKERERFLEAELRSMQTRGLSGPGRLDEETVTTLLGEEAARVLTVARDASTQIRERAEESATRLVKDAAEDAARIRESAVAEAQRIRDDAAADAEAEIEMAKQQGRDMVNEAREYREKVLSELSRRRDAARNQIEQLLHGRDRLLNAFERARIASESVLTELHAAHDEPETLISLSPTTGPIPVVNPHHPSVAAYDHAAAEAAESEVRAAIEEAEALVDGATGFDIPLDGPSVGETDVVIEDNVTADDVTVDDSHESVTVIEEPVEAADDLHVDSLDGAGETDVTVIEDRGDEGADTEDSASSPEPDDAPATNVVSLFDRRPVRVAEVPQDSPAPAVEEKPVADHPVHAAPAKDAKVDDIFARLRAGSTETVAKGSPAKKSAAPEGAADEEGPAAAPAAASFEPVVDPARFSQRDEALAPVVPQIARKLKRVLADEQNNVLEHLRNKRSSLEIDAVLGTVAEHAKRYAAAVSEDTMAAASAGAKSMKDARGNSRRVTQKAVGTAITDALAAGLVEQFREDARIAIGEAEGDRQILAGLMRDVYRKWKMTGIDAHVDDVACAAYNAGAYLSLEPTASIHWLVEAEAGCCGDCADNSLAGAVTKGQTFPTGDMHPMAHEGCRCLIGPASH